MRGSGLLRGDRKFSGGLKAREKFHYGILAGVNVPRGHGN
jgi:hypothetical protein